MPPDDVTQLAIDRALQGVKELLDAKLDRISVELAAIGRRLDQTERLRDRVEGHEIDITALQAVSQTHGHDIQEIKTQLDDSDTEQRQDRRDRFGHVIGALGIIVAIVAVVGNHL